MSGNFVVKQILQALRKTTAESDQRLPITHSILKSLIRSFERLNFSYFLSFNESHVFNSFLCLSPHWSTTVNNIQWQSVQFLLNDNQIPYAFELNMEKFKHIAGKTCHKLRVQENFQQP